VGTKRPSSSAKKAAPRASRAAPSAAKARSAKKSARKPASVKLPSQKSAHLGDALAAASWAEADRSLAQGLSDLAALESSVDTLSRTANEFRASVDMIEERMMLARQSLEHVARVRGFERFGVVGAVEEFNPRLHDLIGAQARAPSMVRIRAQGMARGAGDQAKIMLKAQAEPAPRARVRSRRRS